MTSSPRRKKQAPLRRDFDIRSLLPPSADIPDVSPRGPGGHHEMARQLGIPRNSGFQLTVLAPNNDPFYKGTAAHVQNGQWFAGLLDQFGYGVGFHIRRVHYRLVSADPKINYPDDAEYRNTENDSHRLDMASAAARILGFVDAESFIDRRNKAATENAIRRDEPFRSTGLGWSERRGLYLPNVDLDPLRDIRFSTPTPWATGYDYHPGDQPVMIEVWVEKSTMNDIVRPLCEASGFNYVEGEGHESITQTVLFLRRAQAYGKAAHIIYVSDFDPGGEGMPLAVARHIQFWREQLEIDIPITVDAVALTHDQCVKYKLPRTPLKEEIKGKDRWEERYGEGATELDALEALKPGELAKIILKAAEPYRDQSLRTRLTRALVSARQAIRDEWEALGGSEIQTEAEELSEQVQVIADEQADKIQVIIDETETRLQPLIAQADDLEERVSDIEADFDVDLPQRPAAEYEGEADVLFDSDRHWLEQLAYYRDHQGTVDESTVGTRDRRHPRS